MLNHSASNTISDVNAAVLVSLDFGNSGYLENLEELRQLATSDELTILAVIKGKCSRPNPATYAASGKVNEIALILKQTGATLVIFNHNLSPAQQRNLEQ
jgi:GTP-binding protein HflX